MLLVVIAIGVDIFWRVRLGVKLVEDAFDPVLAGYRIVVDEPELGRALQAKPRSDLASEEGRRTAEGTVARFPRFGVAEHGVEDACDLQIRTDLNPRQRHESDARIVHLASEHGRQLASYLISHAIRPGTL